MKLIELRFLGLRLLDILAVIVVNEILVAAKEYNRPLVYIVSFLIGNLAHLKFNINTPITRFFESYFSKD